MEKRGINQDDRIHPDSVPGQVLCHPPGAPAANRVAHENDQALIPPVTPLQDAA